MTTDLELACYSYASYYTPETFTQIVNISGVYAGIKKFSDRTIIAFRGSDSQEDWLRDIKAKMILDNTLGGVEEGFFEGILDFYEGFEPDLSLPVYITGHSLGGAHALIYAALLAPKAHLSVVTFGAPAPGDSKLKAALAGVSIREYKNNTDFVTTVPLSEDGYYHPSELITVNCAPISLDLWFIFKNHHIQYYVTALALKENLNAG